MPCCVCIFEVAAKLPLWHLHLRKFLRLNIISSSNSTPNSTSLVTCPVHRFLPIILRFHPPDPGYRVEFDEEAGRYTLFLNDDAHMSRSNNTKVVMLDTRTKTKVPVIVITHPNAKYTLLYSHGNATDCGAMYPMYAMLADFLKVNVVGYDYTGYGASMEYGKRATERQTYIDIEAVYDYCLESKLVVDPSKEIILYGQSVGSGPSCYIAPRKPIAGIVLHAPIMSGLRVLTDSRMLACFDIFPNIARIKGINVPLFVIHGEVRYQSFFLFVAKA